MKKQRKIRDLKKKIGKIYLKYCLFTKCKMRVVMSIQEGNGKFLGDLVGKKGRR